MQSEYRIPKGRCVALLDDLHRAGMLHSPGFQLPDDGILIALKKHASNQMPLGIDFSECQEADQDRQITIIWRTSEKDVAANLEAVICKNGGVVVYGGVLKKR